MFTEVNNLVYYATLQQKKLYNIGPRSQLIITSILASVQFTGTVIWIMVAFPDAERVYPNRHEVRLKIYIAFFKGVEAEGGLLMCLFLNTWSQINKNLLKVQLLTAVEMQNTAVILFSTNCA